MFQVWDPIGPVLGIDLFSSIVCCLIYFIGFIIWIYMIFWIYRDAERRGGSGVLWALLMFFFGWSLFLMILILIIWLIIRGPIQSNAQQVHHHYHGTPPQQQAAQFCPTCGQPMRWIQQHNRWYCNYCRQYK